MLEGNYSKLFAGLIEKLKWRIELPAEMADFFESAAAIPANAFDMRRCPRMRSRHRGVLYFNRPLPAFPRSGEPVGVFTVDLSRTGFGCLCGEQLFPGEEIRVLLPNCWLEATVARGRRLGPRCFEVGSILKAVHKPASYADYVANLHVAGRFR